MRPCHALRVSFGSWAPGPARTALHYFHVRRAARDTYGFADAFFSTKGDVVFANQYQAHAFALAINEKRDVPDHERLRASDLHAMGLIHELLHAVIGLYRSSNGSGVFANLLAELGASFGDHLDRTLHSFIERFPPPSVYRGRETTAEFLRGSTDGVPNREWALEEMILLWVSNQNPGYQPIDELVTDRELAESTRYLPIIQAVSQRLATEAAFGPDGQSLIDLLMAPIRHSPGSLAGQLEFMRARWGVTLAGAAAWSKLLGGLDFIREEGLWFLRQAHGNAGSDALVPQTFAGPLYEHEPEKFSQDTDWMPRVVMIAKSTFVWLGQLTKRYGRPVRFLSDIPDEELAELAARGFTALWLIGLWTRSTASKTIKQLQGNREATASAYSLHDYDIAPELGGEGAYQNLRERAARYRIRLASDMVPNHMGLDSRWVIEHPERFIQTAYPPFPGYTFTGPELSTDPRISLRIEDGYWRRSDAAVVFQRVDRHTGDVRYIYHGNDGTTMPWNDTAQLDYLRADVREAVIETILHVARKFPIIRFDAAMTLAKKHYQRLWFPLPGTGGAIPSRGEHAMTKERFDELFPAEFWREVVDRVAVEVPNTLLLAEAFWLMEGYFVRTLGMHRVYNSAFMNMLKREDNAGYRTSIKNVLEFNPQILKRHVNFMNNPDEEPAIVQFGKDDKYFGVCVLLATMPGLPMFGHGQVEGFHEKYGMEFVEARWDEAPDEHLVERHRREIFPILKKRYLFSDVEQFYLYDFVTPEGHVDEDVFAYSNRVGDERALVVYHNKYKDTRGTLRSSVGYLGPDGQLVTRTLVDGLGLGRGDGRFLVWRDAITGLEHLAPLERIHASGFSLHLRAFEHRVLLDLREVEHTEARPYADLERELGGRGVAAVDDAAVGLRLRAIHTPFYEAVNAGSALYLAESVAPRVEGADPTAGLPEKVLREKLEHVVAGWAYLRGDPTLRAPALVLDGLAARLVGAMALLRGRSKGDVAPAPFPGLGAEHLFVAWMYTEALARTYAGLGPDEEEPAVIAWRLGTVLERAFKEAGASPEEGRRAATLLVALVRRAELFRPVEEGAKIVTASADLAREPGSAPATSASPTKRPEHDPITGRVDAEPLVEDSPAEVTSHSTGVQSTSVQSTSVQSASDPTATVREDTTLGAIPEATPRGAEPKPRAPSGVAHPSPAATSPHATMLRLLEQEEVRGYLATNSWEGVVYVNKERFEELVRLAGLLAACEEAGAERLVPGQRPSRTIEAPLIAAEEMVATGERAKYQLAALRDRLSVLGHKYETITRL